MKRFTFKLILCTGFAAALTGYGWWQSEAHFRALPHPVNANLDRAAKILKLTAAVPDARFIFAGDSRAERQLDPEIFQSAGLPAINIATSSGDLWGLTLAMEATGLQNSPATFLISVTSEQVNDGAIGRGYLSEEQFFALSPWERLRLYKSGYFLAARNMLREEDRWRDFGAALHAVAQEEGFFPHRGYSPSEPHEFTCRPVRHHSNVSDHVWYRDLRLDGIRWGLFEKAVEKLSQWPGTYVLFNPPVSPKWRQCIAGSYIEAAEREYGRRVSDLVRGRKNIKFIDFFAQAAVDLPDSVFYDPVHLDRHGAEIFTRWWVAQARAP